MPKKLTTIYLNEAMQEMKREIEQSLDGGRLTHQAIYNRGLVAYKELMTLKKVTINLDNLNNQE